MRKVTVIPEHFEAYKEKVLQIAHSDDAVEQESDEVWKVAMRDAIVDPYAVMVHSRHTSFADAAMLTPCWFQKLAS